MSHDKTLTHELLNEAEPIIIMVFITPIPTNVDDECSERIHCAVKVSLVLCRFATISLKGKFLIWVWWGER